jgi:CCR4-NOT transcription complex subunit 1 HEAT repeat
MMTAALMEPRHCSTYMAAATGSEIHHASSASAGVSQCVCPQEVKGLAMVLERTPYPLAIELAALASQRGILSLQPWLQVLMCLHITATEMR